MSTDIFNTVADACKPSNVVTLPPRKPAEHTYRAVLIRDDVTIGELAHALRFSGIVISTDPLSGQTTIHRSPKDAA